MPDYINTALGDGGRFNERRQLFNKNDPTPVRAYLRPLDEDTFPDDPSLTSGLAPRTRIGGERLEEVRPARAVPRRVVFGYFSAVRSSRIVHQHIQRLWDAHAFPKHFGASTQPDPSPQTVDQMYEDFQLFSYLPPEIAPSRAEFEDYAKPQKRADLISANLPRMGIVTTPPSSEGVTPPQASEEQWFNPFPVELVSTTPFTSPFRTGCAERLERLLGVNR